MHKGKGRREIEESEEESDGGFFEEQDEMENDDSENASDDFDDEDHEAELRDGSDQNDDVPGNSDFPGHNSGDAVKHQLENHQRITKLLINQLHLLNKFNAFALRPEFKNLAGSSKPMHASLQFHLMLLLKDLLGLQTQFQDKTSSATFSSESLLKTVNGYLFGMLRFYQKKNPGSYNLDLSHLQKSVSVYTNGMLDQVRPAVDKWNTATLPQLTVKLSQSQKSPFLLVEESLSKPEKIKAVYSLKPDSPELLAKRNEAPNENPPINIYEDAQIIHELTKELLLISKSFRAEMQEGLVFKNTEDYLRERLAKGAKVKKVVDFDARKDKKVKFDTHDKIMNFMAPVPNKQLWENRDEIVAGILGRRKQKENKAEERKDAVEDISLF